MRKAPQPEPSRAALIARRPREFACGLMAAVASGWIFTNALFLQTGPHPAPIFAAPKPAMETVPIPPAAPRGQMAQPERMRVQPASVRHVEPSRPNDQIAALLAPTPRVMAVQQALADFAYGPVVPTGVLDPQTRAAVERFEKARGLPIDGQLSELVLHELATVAGRTFE